MKQLRQGIRQMLTQQRHLLVKRQKKAKQEAAVVLQQWFKKQFATNRARHALANLVMQMWVCRTHPETGQTMWVNLNTHKIQVHASFVTLHASPSTQQQR